MECVCVRTAVNKNQPYNTTQLNLPIDHTVHPQTVSVQYLMSLAGKRKKIIWKLIWRLAPFFSYPKSRKNGKKAKKSKKRQCNVRQATRQSRQSRPLPATQTALPLNNAFQAVYCTMPCDEWRKERKRKKKERINSWMNYLCVCVCIGETHTSTHTSSPIISKHLAIVFLSFFSSFFFHTGQLLFHGEGREGKGSSRTS